MKFSGPVWLMQPIPYFGEPIGDGWIYEPKIDGWRMQLIRFGDGRVEVWGRRLEKEPNWTHKLPSLVEVGQKVLSPGTLLDCELYTRKGRRFIPSLFAKEKRLKPLVWVFDIIFYKGNFVGDLPLIQRKAILKGIGLQGPLHFLKFHQVVDLRGDLSKLLRNGHEGMVVKLLSSPYEAGRDSPLATQNWRKIKGR